LGIFDEKSDGTHQPNKQTQMALRVGLNRHIATIRHWGEEVEAGLNRGF